MKDKLIEILTDDDCPLLYMQGTVSGLADFLMSKGVTVQQWIPIGEQLPKEFVSVLVCIPSEAPLPTVKEAYWASGCWVTKMSIFRESDVTHWQPIPKGVEVDHDTV